MYVRPRLYSPHHAGLGGEGQLSATARLEDNSRWESLARLAVLRNDVYAAMRLLCLDVLSGSSQAESAAQKISDWASTNTSRPARLRTLLNEISVAVSSTSPHLRWPSTRSVTWSACTPSPGT